MASILQQLLTASLLTSRPTMVEGEKSTAAAALSTAGPATRPSSSIPLSFFNLIGEEDEEDTKE